MLIGPSISRLRPIVCTSLLAWLLSPIMSPVAQTNHTTRTTKRDAANSQNAELKSLYEAQILTSSSLDRVDLYARGVIVDVVATQ